MPRPKSNKVRLTQTTVMSETKRTLEEERARTGEPVGVVIDRLVRMYISDFKQTGS